MTVDELPYREREMLQNTLLRGERVLWLGRPQPMLWTLRQCVMVGYLWLPALVLGWFTFGAWQEGFPTVVVVMVGVVALGLLVLTLASPWWGRSWQRRTLYALTDSRAIVLRYRPWGGPVLIFRRHADMIHAFTRHRNGTVSLELGISISWNRSPEGFLYLPAEAWEEPYTLMKQAL